MIGTVFFPLSRVITAVIVFFTSIFSGAGLAAALNRQPPSLQPMLYPRWVHEHWIWENVGDCSSTKEFVLAMEEAGIPVGVVILDRPWEIGIGSCVETQTIDDSTGSLVPCPVRFCCFYKEWEAGAPVPGNTVEEQGLLYFLNERGIKLTLWVTCFVNDNSPNHWTQADQPNAINPAKRSYFLNDGEMTQWWGGTGSAIDFTNPDAVRWLESNMNGMLDLGVVGWKVDGADPFIMTFAPATGHKGLVGWNTYKTLFYSHFYNYTNERINGGKGGYGGGAILARPVDDIIAWGLPVRYMPRDVSFSGWVGDQDNDWGGLRGALNNMFTSSLFNYASYGSDIGGFRSDPFHEPWDVFIRWAQMGMMCPVMEVESTLRPRNHGVHHPFSFNQVFWPDLYDEHGIDVAAIYRDAVIKHTQLIPYFASQVMFSYERRQPVMRPTLGYYQFMMGDELFVAPIVSAGDGTQNIVDALGKTRSINFSGNTRTINFPLGDEWIYWYDESETFRGGSVHRRHFSYEESPVFIRRGAIIPMETVADVPTGAPYELCDYTTIRIYPALGSNRFGLYEEAVNGAMIRYNMTRSTLHITMDATDRDILFRLFEVPEHSSITLGGTALTAAASFEALKASGLGYFIDADGILWIAAQDATGGLDISVDFK